MLIALTLVMISFLYIKSNAWNYEVSMYWHYSSHLNTFIYRCDYNYFKDPKIMLRVYKEKKSESPFEYNEALIRSSFVKKRCPINSLTDKL